MKTIVAIWSVYLAVAAFAAQKLYWIVTAGTVTYHGVEYDCTTTPVSFYIYTVITLAGLIVLVLGLLPLYKWSHLKITAPATQA